MIARTCIVPLAYLTVTVFLFAGSELAVAQSHPQEVLDLISEHDALAMKVRPLHDRVVSATKEDDGDTAFQPDGTPVRAKVTIDGTQGARTNWQTGFRHQALPAGSGKWRGAIRRRPGHRCRSYR